MSSDNLNDWGWVRAAVLAESSGAGGITKSIRVHDEDSEHSGEMIDIPVLEGTIASANEWEEVERRNKTDYTKSPTDAVLILS